MPAIYYRRLLNQPLAFLQIIVYSTLRAIPAVCRTISPSHPLSLRTALARIWIGTIFEVDSTLIFDAPPFPHDVQKLSIESEAINAYVVPSTPEQGLKEADVIVLYCHGGGLMIGHPLQYLDTYERWSGRGKQLGKRIVFIAVQYPLSTTAKWPAQRDAVLATYDHLLNSLGVPPSKIVFGGDSAGSNLATLSMLHIARLQEQAGRETTPLPLPSGNVLISPLLDSTCAQTINSPNVNYDFMLSFNAMMPIVSDVLRPNDLAYDTPEISAILWEDKYLKSLPGQLVLWSTTEALGSDAARWTQRCKDNSVKVQELTKSGELHVWGLGRPFTDKETEGEAGEVVVRWMIKNVSQG